MDINAKDEKGWAPIHLVAIDGNKVIAELLLKSGANVNERTDTGWVPLHLADNGRLICRFFIFSIILYSNSLEFCKLRNAYRDQTL